MKYLKLYAPLDEWVVCPYCHKGFRWLRAFLIEEGQYKVMCVECKNEGKGVELWKKKKIKQNVLNVAQN